MQIRFELHLHVVWNPIQTVVTAVFSVGKTRQGITIETIAHSVKMKECLWTLKLDINSCDILCGQSVIQIRFHLDMHKIRFGLTV